MSIQGLLERLGAAIRNTRTEQGFSQEGFADHIGLHRTYVGSVERGERNLSLENLTKVARGLGLSPSELLKKAETDSSSAYPINKKQSSVRSPLSTRQSGLIDEMAIALSTPVESELSPVSDVCTPLFAEDFQNRLVLYHAMNEDVLKKKTFEYAFAASSKADGRIARLVNNPTHPGTDVVVDEVSFSLKTEAAASISRSTLTISKLMEARWIRGCTTGAEFLRGVQARVAPHLKEYERIVMLRAFKIGDSAFEYHLVEIPREVLLMVGQLTESDFTPRTKNGSSRADVRSGRTKVFSLRLDGSVEKITVSGLRVDVCVRHGEWTVPVLGGRTS